MRGVRLAVLPLFLIAFATWAQSLPAPRVVAVNERVYVLLGPIQHANSANQGYMINSTLIVGDTGAIVVDSGSTAEVGRHIAAAVRRITAKPVTHVVNTHPHGDHYLGNAAFEKATFVSSEMCRKSILESGHEWIEMMERDIGRKLAGTTLVPADVTFATGTKSEASIHGVRVVFWVPLGSHTAGDLLVHLPDDKVLIAGDVLVNGVVPTLQDGFVRNWIRTLEEIAALDVSTFVPGHGDLMTRRDVVALHGQLLQFYSAVDAGYRAGLGETEIRKTLDLSGWEKLERSYVIGRNINRTYLEAEADSFGK
jgi:glyoxylase-like metal-dependent hydrolase (beta-lactamase superfamily II)